MSFRHTTLICGVTLRVHYFAYRYKLPRLKNPNSALTVYTAAMRSMRSTHLPERIQTNINTNTNPKEVVRPIALDLKVLDLKALDPISLVTISHLNYV